MIAACVILENRTLMFVYSTVTLTIGLELLPIIKELPT